MWPICLAQSSGRMRTPRSANGPDPARPLLEVHLVAEDLTGRVHRAEPIHQVLGQDVVSQNQPGVVESPRGPAGLPQWTLAFFGCDRAGPGATK